MTKEEIIDKINAAIRGQGSQVDIGGVLGDILEGIVGLIPTETPTKAYMYMTLPSDGFEDLDAEAAADRLNIPVGFLLKLLNGEYSTIIEEARNDTYLVIVREVGSIRSIYFFRGDGQDWGASYALRMSDGVWSFNEI